MKGGLNIQQEVAFNNGNAAKRISVEKLRAGNYVVAVSNGNKVSYSAVFRKK